MLEKISVKTDRRTQFIDITSTVQDIVSKSKTGSGICSIYVPHTTAGLIINEHADPDVAFDIQSTLEKIIPWNGNYTHSEGNSAAHIKASLTGTSQNIFISDGKLLLGTWQGLFFAEFDGPRSREVWIKIIKS